jgi:hypothetical protein
LVQLVIIIVVVDVVRLELRGRLRGCELRALRLGVVVVHRRLHRITGIVVLGWQ